MDETVREWLRPKVERMAEQVNDSSLRIDPIPLDHADLEDAEDYPARLALQISSLRRLLCLLDPALKCRLK